jgi:predicted ATPase/DNA-binding CsgD family transcriptional regulator
MRAEVRLLVLTGPGGTGKTRLGLQVAAHVEEEFNDGVFFVPLDSISDAKLVDETIARGLGITDWSNKPVRELLIDHLVDKQVLLIIDCFEHVVAAAASLANLLANSAGLKMLVTSREILHLQGEFDFAVPPLSLPDRNTAVNADIDSVPLLLQCEAVHLFVDRAVAAQPEFTLYPENVLIVAEICHRLEGLPLAIELAAARMRLLLPEQMLERLDKRLSFLTRGARDRPSRQQTLRATIDWSYDLLDGPERKIFSRLSVFSGGFTIEAAEEVCRPDDDLGYDVLDGIASLEEKSLLRREDSGGNPRFAMLDTVLEYATERLTDSGESEELRLKHAEYIFALAQKARPEFTRFDQKIWMDKLEREHSNLRSALAWSLEGGQVELGIELATSLVIYWADRHLNEGRDWFDKAMSTNSTPSFATAKLLYTAGYVACELGETVRGMKLLEQCVTMSRELEDIGMLGAPLSMLAGWSFWTGDTDKAIDYAERALVAAKASEDIRLTANTLDCLGQIAAERGDLDRAERLVEEGFALTEEGSKVVYHFVIQMDLGSIAKLRGDFGRATALTEQSLTKFRQAGNRYNIAAALVQLCSICIKLGNVKRSKALLEEATTIFRDLGLKGRVFDGYTGVSHCLIFFADISMTEDRIEQAVRLLGASTSIQAPVDDWLEAWRTTSDGILATAHVQLEDKRYETVWNEGQAMSFEEAVSYAIEKSQTEPDNPLPDGLSNREVEVAVLLVEGLTNREIGERLFISERTVANHVQSVLNKTGSGNRAEAAAYAIRNGLTH